MSKFVGVVHLKDLKLHKFNLIAILKDVYLVGLPFCSRYSGKGTSGALHSIQPIHKDLGAGTGKKCRMPQFGIQRTGKDCLSICKLLQRLLEEDMFWNWAAAAIAIVKSTHGGLNDGVQFASFFSSVFVLGFLLGIYPH